MCVSEQVCMSDTGDTDDGDIDDGDIGPHSRTFS